MIKRGLLVVLVLMLSVFFVGANSLGDFDENDFSDGTFSNTFYNGSFVQLNESLTSGSYESGVFDPGLIVSWNNFTFTPGLCYGCELPDGNGFESGYGKHNVDMSGNVLLLHLDESSGTLFDSSGNGNDATCSGNGCPTYGSSGKFGNSLSFSTSGQDDFLSVSDSSDLDITGDIAIEAWTFANSFVNNPDIVTKGDFSEAYSLWYRTTGEVSFAIDSDVNGALVSNSVLSLNNWHHVVVLREGNTRRIYIDGQLDSSDTYSSAITTNNNPLFISTSAFGFSGRIDEVAVYNRSLSAEEIEARYLRGVARLNLSVRSCDDSSCIVESYVDVSEETFDNLSLNDNRYFQYNVDFETDDSGVSPELYNFSAGFSANNSAPSVSVLNPGNLSYNFDSFDLEYTAFDSEDNLGYCWYSLDLGVTNSSADNNCGNFSGLSANQGSNIWRVYANDSLGLEGFDEVSFYVDSISPEFSGFIENPSNGSVYSQGEVYEFNVTVSDDSLDSYGIEFGGINYSVSESLGVLSFVISDLSAGDYSYYWWANDSLGNFNISGSRVYSVVMNDGDVGTFVNGSRANLSVTEGDIVEINVSLLNGDFGNLSLSINGSLVLSDSSDISVNYQFNESGVFEIVGEYSGSENYTSVSESWFVDVSVAPDLISPVVSILSPVQDEVFDFNESIALNYSVSDDNLDSCWYSLDGVNISLAGCTNSTFNTSNGSHEIFVFANDSSGNIGLDSVNFSVNLVEDDPGNETNGSLNSAPYVVLNSPVNGSNISSDSINLNLNVFDDDLDLMNVFVYGDGKLLVVFSNQTNGTTMVYNWAGLSQGIHNWSARVSDGINETNSSVYYFSAIYAVAPDVIINYPSDFSVYAVNESIPLNFSAYSDYLDRCWYNINNGPNITSCVDSSFTPSVAGDYTFNVFANESIGGLVGSDSVGFSVVDINLSVHLVSPDDNYYTNSSEVNFSFVSTSGAALNSCDLLGDFGGVYGINQSLSFPEPGELTSFVLNLTPGDYSWSVRCTDVFDNSSITGNRSLHVDMEDPNVTIRQPDGDYEDSDVPLELEVNDSSPIEKCEYQLDFSVGGIPIQITVVTSCEGTTISVGSENDYSITVTASDGAGNSGSDNKDFSVGSSGGSDSSNTGGSSSPGGGSGGDSPGGFTGGANLEIENVPQISLKRGDSGSVSIDVFNSGQRFLNDCSLRAEGVFESWTFNNDILDISSGQRVSYILGVDIPIEANPGIYVDDVIVECVEINVSVPLSVSVLETAFDFRVIETERTDIDDFRIVGLLRELGGVEQSVDIVYRVISPEGIEISDGSASFDLSANEEIEVVLDMRIPRDAFGDFDFVIVLDNGFESREIVERVTLSSPGITGFAISDENQRALSVMGVIVISLLIVLLVARFIKNHDRRSSPHRKGRHFIKLDLGHK